MDKNSFSIKALDGDKFEIQLIGGSDGTKSTFVVPAEFALRDLDQYITTVQKAEDPEPVPGTLLHINMELVVCRTSEKQQAQEQLLMKQFVEIMEQLLDLSD